MAVGKQVVAIHIDDCKIYELTADTSTAPTYSTGIDVPNIVSMMVQPQIDTQTVEGDNVVDSVFTTVTHATGSIQFNAIPLDVLGIMLGSTVTGSGTTPNAVQTFSLGQNNTGKYFKLVGRAVNVEGIDNPAAGLKVTVWKAKLTGNPQITIQKGVASLTGEFTAVRTRSDKKLLDIVTEETQTTIS